MDGLTDVYTDSKTFSYYKNAYVFSENRSVVNQKVNKESFTQDN